jgi:Transposase DDE domain group 1
VVEKVEFHFGELFLRVGFIVTNLRISSRAVVRFYNKRGMAEQWIKEGKQAVAMTRLSCHRFRANEVRLWLSLIAYNLGNLWRRLTLPAPIEKWSLTSLQQRLVKTRGKVDKARPVLLVAARREPSDAAAVWRHARENRGAAGTGGIGRIVRYQQSHGEQARRAAVRQESVLRAAQLPCRWSEGLERPSPAAGSQPRVEACVNLTLGFLPS